MLQKRVSHLFVFFVFLLFFFCLRRWWHIWSCLTASHVRLLMPCHSDSSQPARQRIMGAVSGTAGRSEEGKLNARRAFPHVTVRVRACVWFYVWLGVVCACVSVWRDGCMPKARATPCQTASRRSPFQIHEYKQAAQPWNHFLPWLLYSLPLCSMCVSKVWQGALVIC